MIIHTELSFFGDEVESIRSFDVATQLSLEKQKKITIIPNVENKVFRKIEKVFRLYFGENGAFIKIQKIYFRSWISSSTEQKKLLKNCQGTSNMPPDQLFLNQKTFIKKTLDFSIVELSVKPILESPINLNSTFSHNPHSTSNLICC
jgi:transcription-repair coupling factor (superfamily II helicase)